ncbi:hypothetical protein CAPTEDRAFT_226222 [Capitella teleta]|uniref:WD repeat domain-containing protein 83 n=1 Tax=Capitella teleta TaxID=283909 RepID=R7TR53_CAPTE|nr:hypothetical protein CAPTEDRAFT_226222 [Capitella teleta]|eukprot:ELT93971.1 hypothetical protein CAPTEDRAFT_226222 [Capitella teleta]
MTILQWNCRGFRANFEELKTLVAQKDATVVCLQEIKLEDSDNCSLNGIDCRAVGGAAVLIKKDTPHQHIPLTTNLQAVAVRVTLHRLLTVCSIYLPPGRSHGDLVELDRLVQQLPPPLLLLGDFNAHNFKPITHEFYKEKWQEQWSSEQENKLYCIQPTLGKWAKSSWEIRREEIVLARARIGHSHLTHGYLLRREMPPVCIPCQTDGNYCLTCGSDKSLKLFNPHTGAQLKSYNGHGYEVLDAQGSCDNSQLCSCGMDKTVILWDVASGSIVRKYRGHAGRVNCVKFNEESTVILSGSIDSTVKVWDTRSRKMEPMQVMDEATDSVNCIQVTDFEILTGSVDGKVRRYDLRNGEMISDYIGKPVTSVCISQDGQCVLTGTLDNTLRLIDKDSGELLNEYTGHKNSNYKIDSSVSSSDTHILSGSEDGHVYVWDFIEAKVVNKLPHKGQVVHSLSYHPKDACLLTASERLLYVWKTKHDEVVA